MSAIPPFGKAGILKNLWGATSKFTKSVWQLSSDVCGECGERGEDRYSGLDAAGSNLSASDSRITDVESAREIVRYAQSKILSGAALSVSGQANQTQRRIISLIQ